MKLLIDTDAFCKLGIAQLLPDAVNHLGVDLQDCLRLPALPHMLRRGRLRQAFSPDACDALLPMAEAVPPLVQPTGRWLEMLTPIEAIDPGEAQIFATAAEACLIVMTGDKRALRALRSVAGFPHALAGRIVVLEAILLALCTDLGDDEVRRRVQPLVTLDKTVQVCFSEGNPDPSEALLSYYGSLVEEMKPLVLWNPRIGGGE